MSSARSLLVPFLNHDIMTYIFNLNTQTVETEGGCVSDAVQPPALHTTRHTSQVCRSWRQIILQSPAIWGNVIDLQTLGDASEEWFEEVMRRTGKASLSIFGQIEDSSTMERFVSLLESDWHRVRRLDILVFEDDPEIDFDRFYDVFWKCPAPSLEKFIVYIDVEYHSDEDKAAELELFAGSAPLLRRIHSPAFHFNHHASWISQLYSVTLSDPLKITDALNVLINTPLLESLVIHSTVEYDSSAKTWQKKIHLPNLRLINIASDITGSLVYLSYIIPSSECALNLVINQDSSDFHRSDSFQRLMDIIRGYAKGYFGGHCPKKLLFYITDNAFQLHAKKGNKPVYFGHPEFKVYLRLEAPQQIIESAAIDMLLSTLSSANFRTVEEFDFTVFDTPWLPTTDVEIQILRSLTSVRNMILTSLAMRGLNHLEDSATFFPVLTDVKIEHETASEDLDQMLRLFLTRRKKAGALLQTLYMPEYPDPQGTSRWVFLKEFEGLRVVSGAKDSRGDGDDDDNDGDGDDNDDSEDDDDDDDDDEDDGDNNEDGINDNGDGDEDEDEGDE